MPLGKKCPVFRDWRRSAVFMLISPPVKHRGAGRGFGGFLGKSHGVKKSFFFLFFAKKTCKTFIFH